MNSGELTENVTVLKPVTDNINEFCERETDYTEFKNVRMKVSSRHGTAKSSHDIDVQDYTITFSCYYYLSLVIDETMRLRWDGHDYHITSISSNRRRNETYIECDRVND